MSHVKVKPEVFCCEVCQDNNRNSFRYIRPKICEKCYSLSMANKIYIPRVKTPEEICLDKCKRKIKAYERTDYKCGLQFDLTLDWFMDTIKDKPCVYCGMYDNIGCDRLDNSIGHIKTNCVPCCHMCNMMRGNKFTYDEMVLLGKVINEIKHTRKISI